MSKKDRIHWCIIVVVGLAIVAEVAGVGDGDEMCDEDARLKPNRSKVWGEARELKKNKLRPLFY